MGHVCRDAGSGAFVVGVSGGGRRCGFGGGAGDAVVPVSATVLHGDCLEILPTLEAESFHAVVTDPPYELGFMSKRWDSTGVAFSKDTWAAVARVMRPGAYLAAFGGTRTFHRMACAIEDAGFEIRDTCMWLYGVGFPKSHDVSKAIDKLAGAEREVIGTRSKHHDGGNRHGGGDFRLHDGGIRDIGDNVPVTAPATPEAARWSGWGTALKPAWEPIILARKPLVGTVAENVLRHGTGGMNIDASRVPLGADDPLQDGITGRDARAMDIADTEGKWGFKAVDRAAGLGRWPANLLHDGSDEVVGLFPDVGKSSGGGRKNGDKFGGGYAPPGCDTIGFGDSGSAARFFYSAKASAKDRAGSKHPTVKPLALMRWLCTLITPPGGRILDPFAGSGTTLQAARECGFDAIGIEREAEYISDIQRRLAEMPKLKEAANDTMQADLFA